MDFIWNKITEWLKEILVGGIMSNMTKLFDQVNRQVGDIAAQVGTTPAAWNSGVFNMIRTLSANVILPIAGVILAIVMTMELGELFGMWFQSLFVGVTMSVLTIVIFVVIYGRMVEIYLVTSIAPLPMATMLNRE
ncbi:MAG: CD0415/CD1112 family protein, partial [Clostridia bacterium]